jgi:hypothetical protein
MLHKKCFHKGLDFRKGKCNTERDGVVVFQIDSLGSSYGRTKGACEEFVGIAGPANRVSRLLEPKSACATEVMDSSPMILQLRGSGVRVMHILHEPTVCTCVKKFVVAQNTESSGRNVRE